MTTNDNFDDFFRAVIESAAASFAVGEEAAENRLEKLGTANWVIAPRLTHYLRSKGYDQAVSQKRMHQINVEFGLPRLRAALASYSLSVGASR